MSPIDDGALRTDPGRHEAGRDAADHGAGAVGADEQARACSFESS